MDEVTFRASFPPIGSALKVAGNREGMRVQLDIPESEMAAAVHLFRWREMVLEITVRPAQLNRADMGYGKKQHDNQARGSAKSQWQAAEKPRADGDAGGNGEPDR